MCEDYSFLTSNFIEDIRSRSFDLEYYELVPISFCGRAVSFISNMNGNLITINWNLDIYYVRQGYIKRKYDSDTIIDVMKRLHGLKVRIDFNICSEISSLYSLKELIYYVYDTCTDTIGASNNISVLTLTRETISVFDICRLDIIKSKYSMIDDKITYYDVQFPQLTDQLFHFDTLSKNISLTSELVLGG